MRAFLLLSLLLVLSAIGCRTSRVSTAPRSVATVERRPLPPPAEIGPGGGYLVDWRLVEEETHADPVKAPRVLVRPSELATVTIGQERSFVQTFDAEVTDGAMIADPVIGILAEGVEIEALVAPTPAPDGHARLAFRVLRTKLDTPMREREVRFVANGAPGRIQLPRVVVSEVVGAVRVPLDHEIDLGVLPARGLEVACRVWVEVHEIGDVRTPHPGSEERATPPEPEVEGGSGRPDALGWEPLHAPDLEAMVAALSDAPVAGTHPRLRIVRAPEHRPAAPVVVASLDLPASLVAGTRRAELFERAYLQDYDAVDGESQASSRGVPHVYEPVVSTLVTGVRAEVVTDGAGPKIAVEWHQTRETGPFAMQLPNGPRVEIDLPETQVLSGAVPLGASRIVPIGKVIVGDEPQRVYLSLTYE